MKTSNMLFLAGILVVFSSMMIFDVGLTETYKSKVYLQRFRNYITLDSNAFGAIVVNTHDNFVINVERGPCKVRVRKSNEKAVNVKNSNGKLMISTDPADSNINHFELFITCPSLSQLDIWYADIDHEQKANRRFYNTRNYFNITGISSDSLTINESNYTALHFDSTNIVSMKVSLAAANEGASSLEINNTNHIGKGNFDVGKNGNLVLAANIASLTYKLHDSATISFSGAVERAMKNK